MVGSTDCGLLEGYVRGTNTAGFFPAEVVQEVNIRQKNITNVSTAIIMEQQQNDLLQNQAQQQQKQQQQLQNDYKRNSVFNSNSLDSYQDLILNKGAQYNTAPRQRKL